jgi:hypothetical protein
MRRLLLVIALAACGSRQASAPAWPKQHEVADDGGEGLAPRESNQVAVAVEQADDETTAAAPEVKAATPAADPAATATPASAPATQDEPIMGEDITIEIEE